MKPSNAVYIFLRKSKCEFVESVVATELSRVLETSASLASGLASVYCLDDPLITTKLRPSLSSGTNCGGKFSLCLFISE